eukprot:scaffold211344_cov22-Tisochrysis_lutea.AAC.3
MVDMANVVALHSPLSRASASKLSARSAASCLISHSGTLAHSPIPGTVEGRCRPDSGGSSLLSRALRLPTNRLRFCTPYTAGRATRTLPPARDGAIAGCFRVY